MSLLDGSASRLRVNVETKDDVTPMFDIESAPTAPVGVYSPRKGHQASLLDRLRANKGLMTMVYLAIWYSFSTAATFTNKTLIKQYHVSAEMLTLSHLFISVICDLVLLTLPINSRVNTWKMQPISVRRVMWIMPLSLFAVVGKVLTYWSYSAVPVAIAHTCKASQPFFNVMLAYGIYRSKFSLATYLSLVPIVLGVVMASVSEMAMNDLAFGGAIFAVSAAFLGVMQSMYAKFLLRSRTVMDSVNLHFYGSFISFAINAPFVLYKIANKTPSDSLVQTSFPYTLVLICSLMHFIGSFCSNFVLSEVSELTFSIMSTMKRVVIILSAVFYFGTTVTTQSVTGMILAMGGVGAYQLIKVQSKVNENAPLPRTMGDISKDRSK
ncbi:hypothetical protein Poli38472_002170 [Pythium oligandrum]|uniref:Sugar phosphate transporter domain-containing protein n=1 Tax=Pythium oligandrum TaxID=41045 RepID=A0A8K1CHN3_PYTOL|nr:hypothetical protein Poli38472_002170 [Pythium oligandrum]|eukprot:TMW63229.1 hypothetical protein Poli38472_002170 [Pythium oligandrum]